MNKTIVLSVLVLILVGSVIASTGISFSGRFFGKRMDPEAMGAIQQAIEENNYIAWKEAMMKPLSEEYFNKIVERHEVMEIIKQALEEGDYDAWKEAIESLERTPRIAEIITEENFGIFVQMRNAMEDGDYETVKELRGELGIEKGHCPHKGGLHGGFFKGCFGRCGNE